MLDEDSGVVSYHKVSSTPHDPSEAIAQGLEDLVQMHLLDPTAITLLGHGTTVATNLVIERKGARVGLVTTRGFRDVLEIGRQTRPHLYNYRVHRPTPLVPRALRLEVEERVMADGSILTPLNMADLEKAGELFRKAEVTAIAVCFLHSYREPDHERRAGQALRQMLPEAYITLSSDVLPEFREFERMSTTVLNAYMGTGKNLGDGIDYGQRFGKMGERVTEALTKLELNGGPDALVNLKYCCPSYESALLLA